MPLPDSLSILAGMPNLIVPGNPIVGVPVAGFGGLAKNNCENVGITIAPGTVTIATAGGTYTGVFVHDEPGFCTLGTLTAGREFFYSSNFGGCDFALLRNVAGQFIGAHVYSNDACRTAIQAPPVGWQFICSYSSKDIAALEVNMVAARAAQGHPVNLPTMSIVCTIEGNFAEFILMKINGAGQIVSSTVQYQHAF